MLSFKLFLFLPYHYCLGLFGFFLVLNILYCKAGINSVWSLSALFVVILWLKQDFLLLLSLYLFSYTCSGYYPTHSFCVLCSDLRTWTVSFTFARTNWVHVRLYCQIHCVSRQCKQGRHEALTAFYSTSRPVSTQECGAVLPCTDVQGPVCSRDRAGTEREHGWGVMFG